MSWKVSGHYRHVEEGYRARPLSTCRREVIELGHYQHVEEGYRARPLSTC